MIKFCHDKELPMPLLHVKMSMGQSERRHGRDKEDKEEGSGKSEGGTGIDAATPAYWEARSLSLHDHMRGGIQVLYQLFQKLYGERGLHRLHGVLNCIRGLNLERWLRMQ